MAQAFMWGMASQLSDAMISQLAAYYAAQSGQREASTPAAAMKTGQAIFRSRRAGRQCRGVHDS